MEENGNRKELYHSYLVIHTGHIRENIAGILRTLPEGVQLIPVLKANAYGLGMEKMAGILQEFPEIRMLAAAQVREGVQLREAGWEREILILGAAATETQQRAALEKDLTLTVYRPGFLREMAELARMYAKKVKLHCKINTGMNRLGMKPGDELAEVIEEFRENQDVIEMQGAFSHFADLLSAKREMAERQFGIFMEGIEQLETAGIHVSMRHICASAAWEMYPEFCLDAVRIGRRLYYDHPLCPKGNVQDAASWRGRIIDVRERKNGEMIGYGGKTVLKKDSRIALVGIGYGDGMLQSFAGLHAPVLVNGKKAHLLKCCMDQCFVDVSGIPCAIGDEATFFGYDAEGNLLPGREIAGLIGDEACTLTAALGERVLRVWE